MNRSLLSEFEVFGMIRASASQPWQQRRLCESLYARRHGPTAACRGRSG
jgi:hypothetical protein